MHSCRRYDESSNRQVRIPARDYWNIAGRAGRAGEETEGLIIHISISDMDRSDVEYYFNRKDNVEPVQSALYQKLLALTQDRLTEEAFKAEIDPEILAWLFRYVISVSIPVHFRSMLHESSSYSIGYTYSYPAW